MGMYILGMNGICMHGLAQKGAQITQSITLTKVNKLND